jgi:Glycosyltransferase
MNEVKFSPIKAAFMKVVIVNFSYDPQAASEEALCRLYYTTTGWAEALQRKGVQVIVMGRFSRESQLCMKGVEYYFHQDHFPPSLSSWQIPLGFLKKIVACNADVIHLHDFSLSLQTVLLRLLIKRKTAIVLQHHGGGAIPSRKMKLHNWLQRVADAYFFTTIEQGALWFGKDSKQAKKVLPVMEGATFFNYATRDAGRALHCADKAQARILTGMHGTPVFLWVGRLDRNKDPLTVLTGFKQVVTHLPQARLYMIYSSSQLETAVRSQINASPVLSASVTMLGAVPHDQMQLYYESADYFVLGSHAEGSSYALSEALSCGCIPIVTDIPGLRAMTDNGRLGCLWQAGNARAFVEAVFRVTSQSIPEASSACRRFWIDNLSFEAIADKAISHYQQVAQRRYSRQSL